MPIISMFYGIIIRMYFKDHNPPHIHAEYQDNYAIFDLNGDLLEGNMPRQQIKMIAAWCEIHHEELVAEWKLVLEGESVFRIDPLK